MIINVIFNLTMYSQYSEFDAYNQNQFIVNGIICMFRTSNKLWYTSDCSEDKV